MSKVTNIGSRFHSVERGNVVAGANEILDDAKGKKQNVINADVDAELLRLDQSKQNNLTFDNTPTENSNNPVKSSGVYAADKALSDAIEAILILIPSAATALNQLADKNFVNSSIATDTATFRGTSETGLSEAQFIEWANGLTHDMNDYVFWQTIDEAGNTLFKRYKWNGTQWLYEYTLNNSSFTADQWAAITSGITTALVEKLVGLPTNTALQQALNSKQDALTFDNVPTENSNNPVKSGGVYSAVKAEEDARLNLSQTVSEIGGDVSQIEDVIPAGATAQNQLVANASMEAYVASIISNITASFTLSTTDGHINLTLTQVNGQVATLTLSSSDIASAQALTALTGRVTTAEGNITSLTGRVSTNETDIANLQQLYNDLQQSKPVPVTVLPETGQQQGVIYRLAGTTSYSDYMWNGSSWVLMATYDNAIDDEPTAGSNNLVKSGGVANAIGSAVHVDNMEVLLYSNNTRIRILYQVKKGSLLKARCTSGKGITAAIYDTREKALIFSSNFLQEFTPDSYTKKWIGGDCEYDGWLVFSLAKTDDSAFTETEKNQFIANCDISLTNNITADIERLQSFDDDFIPLYVKDMEVVMYSNNTRIRLLCQVVKGWHLSAKCSAGRGATCAVYDTREKALIFSSNFLQEFTSDGYTTKSFGGSIDNEGWLVFSLAKTDNSEFSDAEKTQFINSCSIFISKNLAYIDNNIDDVNHSIMLADGYTKLFIGTLVQKGLDTNGQPINTNLKRASMISAVNVPYSGVTIYIKMPSNYRVGIRSGVKSNDLNYDDYWYTGGASFTFNANAVYFRLTFSKFVGEELNTLPAEVEKLIEEGEIEICYKEEDNIISRNYETEKYVKSMMRTWGAADASTESHVMPIFAHTSDVHGDATRFKQFMDYCDYLGVDAALVSGDVVALVPIDSSKYIDDLVDSHITMTLLCVGNHDGLGLDSQAQYEQIMSHLMTKNEVMTNPNETYPTYFYKDFADKKIRVISLNSYEGERVTYTTYFTEEQCNWFINTLASTPQDYGVIVMYHALESAVVKENAHSNFLQQEQRYKDYWQGTTNEPVKKIIDAFISKTILNLTYDTRTYGDYGTVTVNVTADFTSLNSGVEFIAHVTGHEHADGIGLVGGVTNRQVMLNVCCGNGMYGIGNDDILARLSDLPREGRGSVQDAFNIYAIDRKAGTIRIARVGSNMAPNGIKRDFLIMPYK